MENLETSPKAYQHLYMDDMGRIDRESCIRSHDVSLYT